MRVAVRVVAATSWRPLRSQADVLALLGAPVRASLAAIEAAAPLLAGQLRSQVAGLLARAAELPSGRPHVRRRHCREADQLHRTRHAVAAGLWQAEHKTGREYRTVTWSLEPLAETDRYECVGWANHDVR